MVYVIKRGFTLIELLAVLVIVSIIGLIVVPIILNIVEKARKSAFLDSAYGIMESAELYYTTSFLFDDKPTRTFIFPDDKELSFSGKRPKSGYVQISNEGRVELQL